MLNADPMRHRYLKKLYRRSPDIASMGTTARELVQMVHTNNAAAWPQWMEQAENSSIASFGRRLHRDQKAVLAALELPWSNGMVV